MKQIEEKINSLLEERKTVLIEMDEIQRAYDIRQQRLIEIAGSVKTLQELLEPNESETEK